MKYWDKDVNKQSWDFFIKLHYETTFILFLYCVFADIGTMKFVIGLCVSITRVVIFTAFYIGINLLTKPVLRIRLKGFLFAIYIFMVLTQIAQFINLNLSWTTFNVQ